MKGFTLREQMTFSDNFITIKHLKLLNLNLYFRRKPNVFFLFQGDAHSLFINQIPLLCSKSYSQLTKMGKLWFFVMFLFRTSLLDLSFCI